MKRCRGGFGSAFGVMRVERRVKWETGSHIPTVIKPSDRFFHSHPPFTIQFTPYIHTLYSHCHSHHPFTHTIHTSIHALRSHLHSHPPFTLPFTLPFTPSMPTPLSFTGGSRATRRATALFSLPFTPSIHTPLSFTGGSRATSRATASARVRRRRTLTSTTAIG